MAAPTPTVTITASYNGTSRTAPLTVTPAGAPPPAPALQGLLVEALEQRGRRLGSQGVVTLSGAAPAGRHRGPLSIADGGVASVPTSVTVAEGSSNAVFAISTSAVAATTTVTISASADGVTRTATLTVADGSTAASDRGQR